MTITAPRLDGLGPPDDDARVVTSPDEPSIDTVRALAERYSNWGRWGLDDEHAQPHP